MVKLRGEAEVTITLESQDADTYLYLREGEAQAGADLADSDDLPSNWSGHVAAGGLRGTPAG